jgi:hypothetical protein
MNSIIISGRYGWSINSSSKEGIFIPGWSIDNELKNTSTERKKTPTRHKKLPTVKYNKLPTIKYKF